MTKYPFTVFFEFSLPDYDAVSIGIAPSELRRVIHARWADGNMITGVEVFRAVWDAVSLGALTRLSRLTLTSLSSYDPMPDLRVTGSG